jgi:glycosyltransferase involved in cell wall biosynthesis
MNSNRKKILWLASWYPNKYDPFDGDFIQRHARAAAIHNNIHVIAVKEGKNDEESWNSAPGLTEQVIYFRTGNGLLNKLSKQLKWRRLYWKAINDYLKKNGRPDLLHVHVPWKAGLITLEVKKRFGIPYIITEHWGIYNNVLEETYDGKPLLMKVLLKEVYKNAIHVLTPSTYLAQAINKYVTPVGVSVIPNVVDTSIFFPLKEKHTPFTFLHVSNMVPLKNVPTILYAFRKVLERYSGKIQLVLVGNRDNKYISLAEQLGLLDSSVTFPGEIPNAEVAKAMQEAHCLILNSTLENSPCVIGEALCCGLPIITTRVGGIPELVNESNSIFVRNDDLQDLEDAMVRMYEQYNTYNPEQIADKARKKFSFSEIANLHDRVYNRFLSNDQRMGD